MAEDHALQNDALVVICVSEVWEVDKISEQKLAELKGEKNVFDIRIDITHAILGTQLQVENWNKGDNDSKG